MYYWRNLTPEQRAEVMQYRRDQYLPWHRPPHREFDGSLTFIITAACFEHAPVIGVRPSRMRKFEESLVETCRENAEKLFAWCLLPNHYHLLARTDRIEALRKALGQLHGRSSFYWNREDDFAGRKVWYNYFDRDMKSPGHFWASLNYVNNNAVHHGYVKRWQDWPYSSVHQYLEQIGRERAEQIWKEYPVLDYGKGWDIY
jgi:putative transposase